MNMKELLDAVKAKRQKRITTPHRVITTQAVLHTSDLNYGLFTTYLSGGNRVWNFETAEAAAKFKADHQAHIIEAKGDDPE